MCSIFFSVDSVKAIGVSPGVTVIENIAPENSVQRALHISRADVSRDNVVSISVLGDASKYIFVETEELELPKDKRQVPLRFTIAPQGAEPGSYSAVINIRLGAGRGLRGAQLAVLPALAAKVDFTVTNEKIHNVEIKNVHAPAIHEGEEIQLKVLIQNTGNVDWVSEFANVTFRNKKTNREYSFSEEIGLAVGAKENANFSIPISSSVESGIYEGRLSLDAIDDMDVGEKSFSLTVDGNIQGTKSMSKMIAASLIILLLLIIIISICYTLVKVRKTSK